MKASGLVAHEHIHVWNVSNGNRFETYVIPAPKGSGMIKVNGAAAYQAKKGDLIIITSFAHYDGKSMKTHKPKIVFVDDKNRIKKIARKSGRPDTLPVI